MNVTVETFKINYIIVKIKKKPFSDGEIVSESVLCAAKFRFYKMEFKSKIISSIIKLQFLHLIIGRRVEGITKDWIFQMNFDFQKYE